MYKEHFLNYFTTRPWRKVEKEYKDIPVVDIPKITTLDINYSDWKYFAIEKYDLADHDWERVKNGYNDRYKYLTTLNNQAGYDKNNTFVLNYGTQPEANAELLEIFGMDNIKKLNLIPDSVLIRLIVKLPSHGFAWHADNLRTYKNLYPQYADTAKRIWFPVSPWGDGHFFQISKTVISNWEPGDCYEIPIGVPHCGVNFGHAPQFTVSLTGATQ